MIANIFWLAMRMGALCLVSVCIAGWLQEMHPAFDSLSHFRLHFAALLALLAVVFLLGGKWLGCAVSCLVAGISLALSAPYLPGLERGFADGSTGEKPAFSVVQMNLRFNNATPQRASKILQQADADVYLLQEVTRKTTRVLDDLRASHPHQISCHNRVFGSVAIVSRLPPGRPHKSACLRALGYAQAEFMVGNRQVMFATLHTKWPWPERQGRQIERLRTTLDQLKAPLILAGDFNAAPWSAVVARIARYTNTLPVTGLKLTWAPRFVEFNTTIGALLPIDHILHSREIVPVSRTVLGDGGSDHFPVLTNLVLD